MKYLLSILFAVSAWGMPFGQDHLGGAKYPKAILHTMNGQGIGVFANTFGDSLPLLKEVVKKNPPFIRIEIAWRDDHNFSPSDFPKIRKEASRFCPLVRSNPQIKWYFSGACEHHLNEAQARILAQQVSGACPEAEYVNVPLPSGAKLSEYINEVHGAQGPPTGMRYAYSFDGTAAEDSDVESIKKKFPNAAYFLMWSPRYNGRWESNDSTPRPDRHGFADEKMIRSLQYLTNDKGPTSLPDKYLWKSHSENKGTNDPRAEKPVLIAPLKSDAKVTLRRNGKVIDTAKFYGSYNDGRNRFYPSHWGYEVGQVDMFVRDKKIGPLDSGFRAGGFR